MTKTSNGKVKAGVSLVDVSVHWSEQEDSLTPHNQILSKMVIGLGMVTAPVTQFTTRKRQDHNTNDWEQLEVLFEEEGKRELPS